MKLRILHSHCWERSRNPSSIAVGITYHESNFNRQAHADEKETLICVLCSSSMETSSKLMATIYKCYRFIYTSALTFSSLDCQGALSAAFSLESRRNYRYRFNACSSSSRPTLAKSRVLPVAPYKISVELS